MSLLVLEIAALVILGASLIILPLTWIIWLSRPVVIHERPIVGTIRLLSGIAGGAALLVWIQMFQALAMLTKLEEVSVRQYLYIPLKLIAALSILLVAADNIYGAITGESLYYGFRWWFHVIGIVCYVGLLVLGFLGVF